jgi:general stress protein 26
MSARPDRSSEIEKLRRLLDGFRIAMLVTLDVDGRLRARPMASQELDPEGRMWFLTSAASHKIDELRGHEQVNLAFADVGDQRYVSLSGRGTLVRDPRRIDALWSSAYETWFPQGKGDPDLALLCVEVEKAEYWDTPLRTMVVLFEYARSMLTGRPLEGEHHERIDLRSSPGTA